MKIFSLVKLMRPHQWIKNLLLLFPPFFAGKLFDPTVSSVVLPSLLSFSLAASCSYIVNDILDVEADRNHATKKNRAIARGDIPVPFAVVLALVLYVLAMLASSSVSRRFEGFLIVYLLISIAYSIFFKNIVLADIYFISFGFIVRVMAGGEAFQITVTSWLFLTVFMVSLLLAAGKRLGELVSVGENAHKQRKILSQYPQSYLEGLLWFSASTSLVMYALYTLDRRTELIYSVPLAAYGLIRYVYIVKQGHGDPTEALLFDRQILAVGILWVFMVGIILYSNVLH